MARKRKGKLINGWVILDKPLGISSSQAVGKVKWLLNAAKAGHGGTLDPLATGILPIALGEATKTVTYAMDGIKTYQFTVRWGEARATDDAEGEVIETSDVRPSKDQILAALSQFTGDIEQIPPAYSAIKVDGKRAYALARDGQTVELKMREVSVHKLELLDDCDAAGANHASFEVTCGKGTYVRSIARDLAKALGTVGYVSQLRRTAVGPFNEKHAISLDSLDKLSHIAPPAESVSEITEKLGDILLGVETVLDDIPALALTEQETRSLRHGQAISVLPVATREPLKGVKQGDVVCAFLEGQLVALVKVQGGMIHPVRVLNLVETKE
jgi:tRNA pseudouridine55 synthase